jgi:hypothetical protein
LFTKASELKQISKMVFKADILRMETKSIHEVLMSHIHFTDEEAYRTRTGFPLKNLEAGLDGEIFLKFIKPWKMAHRMNKLGMAKVAANVASKGVKQASAIGLIRIKGRDMQSFFEGGRAMESVWLEATRLSLSFQPMTIVTFLWMNWQFGNQEIFSEKHQKLLKSIWVDYHQLFSCKEDESHIMLFRLGYGTKMNAGTLRKKLN